MRWAVKQLSLPNQLQELSQALQDGWEPFAVTTWNNDTEWTYHLRLKVYI